MWFRYVSLPEGNLVQGETPPVVFEICVLFSKPINYSYISINPTRLSKLNVSLTWNVSADLEINIILLRNVSPWDPTSSKDIVDIIPPITSQ